MWHTANIPITFFVHRRENDGTRNSHLNNVIHVEFHRLIRERKKIAERNFRKYYSLKFEWRRETNNVVVSWKTFEYFAITEARQVYRPLVGLEILCNGGRVKVEWMHKGAWWEIEKGWLGIASVDTKLRERRDSSWPLQRCALIAAHQSSHWAIRGRFRRRISTRTGRVLLVMQMQMSMGREEKNGDWKKRTRDFVRLTCSLCFPDRWREKSIRVNVGVVFFSQDFRVFF